MIAPLIPTETTDDRIDTLRNLANRRVALYAMPIDQEQIGLLVNLKADYIRKIGPESYNVAAISRRIEHFKEVLEAIEEAAATQNVFPL